MNVLVLRRESPGANDRYRGLDRADAGWTPGLPLPASTAELQRQYLEADGKAPISVCVKLRAAMLHLGVRCDVIGWSTVVELTDQPKAWQFLGVDPVWYGHSSLLANGLESTSILNDRTGDFELMRVILDFFRLQLNEYGLFESVDVARRFDRCVRALSELVPECWESELPANTDFAHIYLRVT